MVPSPYPTHCPSCLSSWCPHGAGQGPQQQGFGGATCPGCSCTHLALALHSCGWPGWAGSGPWGPADPTAGWDMGDGGWLRGLRAAMAPRLGGSLPTHPPSCAPSRGTLRQGGMAQEVPATAGSGTKPSSALAEQPRPGLGPRDCPSPAQSEGFKRREQGRRGAEKTKGAVRAKLGVGQALGSHGRPTGPTRSGGS